jgi:hypothetical protein
LVSNMELSLESFVRNWDTHKVHVSPSQCLQWLAHLYDTSVKLHTCKFTHCYIFHVHNLLFLYPQNNWSIYHLQPLLTNMHVVTHTEMSTMAAYCSCCKQLLSSITAFCYSGIQ